MTELWRLKLRPELEYTKVFRNKTYSWVDIADADMAMVIGQFDKTIVDDAPGLDLDHPVLSWMPRWKVDAWFLRQCGAAELSKTGKCPFCGHEVPLPDIR